MKKLLILALVLGVTGLAGAGVMTFTQLDDYSAQVSGSGYTIVDKVPEFGGIYVGIVGGVPDIVMNYAGNNVTVTDVTADAADAVASAAGIGVETITQVLWISYTDTTPSPDTVLPNGLLTTFSALPGARGSHATLYVFDDASGDQLVGSPISIIPEPMTIALLGLGGLFIRRKIA